MRLLSALHRTGRDSGFSLTEVVLAIAITAIAVVGVMAAFPVGMTASRDSRDENVVSSIAEDVFSQIRGQPFNAVILPKNPSVDMSMQGAGGVVNASSELFYYSASGAPAGSDISPNNPSWNPPGMDEAYRDDEGYFGVKVTIVNNPYYTVPSGGSGTLPISKLSGLAKVIVDISWPARAPLTPVDRRQHSVFVSYVANLN